MFLVGSRIGLSWLIYLFYIGKKSFCPGKGVRNSTLKLSFLCLLFSVQVEMAKNGTADEIDEGLYSRQL